PLVVWSAMTNLLERRGLVGFQDGWPLESTVYQLCWCVINFVACVNEWEALGADLAENSRLIDCLCSADAASYAYEAVCANAAGGADGS
ncbi:MAG TPA: hypothetical protein VIX42_07235, partial [Edaphobacter sp.]